jgi:hypothetical protein
MHARTREYLHVLEYVGTEDDEVLERERKRGDLGLDGSRQRVLLPTLSRVLLFACLSCDSAGAWGVVNTESNTVLKATYWRLRADSLRMPVG